MIRGFGVLTVVFCLCGPAFGAVSGQQVCDKPTLGHLRPVMETHTLPPYPELARHNHEEGVSLVQVVIGQDGKVTNAELAGSSGSKALDEAAVDHVRQNWRWETQADRCAAPIVTRVQITWKMNSEGFDPLAVVKTVNLVLADAKDYPPDALAGKQSGFVVTSMLQPEIGEPTIYVILSSGSESLDKKTVEVLRTRMRPPELDGKPLGGFVTLAMVWVLPGTPEPDLAKIRTVIEFAATHSFGNGAGVSLPPR